ncbi:1-aminocyclopropane-1-carboxylate oxidase-like protein 12 [Hibiscus syriacus]|uniref:1-aminocyclopropane-1-carboxylate oxidase-like protein 12 n=1 Tax=Hibiscus syriacus TaxID=106335 RepID=A0A6A2Y6G3_HIBSY|nr:1-aminocyclopropane-1-carboxylate oxidase-like protein 12 [Hibiscus syriacus]
METRTDYDRAKELMGPLTSKGLSMPIPIIDLKDVIDPAEHEDIVEKMRLASEKWGFFQVINHGIPQDVINKVIGHSFVCHYYPAYPELKNRYAKCYDPDFLTIILQDQKGLQVLHKDQWIDIDPLEGALIVNIGDLLQLISNDKLRGNEHRVLAKCVGPRILVACFFTTHFQASNKLYGLIKELLSADNSPLYKKTLIKDYLNSFSIKDYNDYALVFMRLK